MCSAHEIRDEDIDANYDFAPIGEISKFFESELANQDSRGVGELVLYGPQVGPGYVGDENSSSNFLYRSADTRPEMRRGYKTGDLMRIDSQGLLRFSGRRDTQVKLMGHRVELAAIEAEILRIPGCWESFVSVIRTEHDSDVVHAWVATTRPPAEVKEFLTKTLPGYMIPRRIHCMSILPKNRNGKVDRLLLRQSVS